MGDSNAHYHLFGSENNNNVVKIIENVEKFEWKNLKRNDK